MKRIGGNIAAELQTYTTTTNYIGESVNNWTTVRSLKGFLDLSGGEAKYAVYDAKLQESTHIFICDYVDLENVTAEESRLIIKNKVYDVVMIDNPQELDYHLEFHLKFVGGQNDEIY